jgi:hypothetical protein
MKIKYNKLVQKAKKQEEWLDGKRGDEVEEKYIKAHQKTLNEMDDILKELKLKGEVITSKNIKDGFELGFKQLEMM